MFSKLQVLLMTIKELSENKFQSQMLWPVLNYLLFHGLIISIVLNKLNLVLIKKKKYEINLNILNKLSGLSKLVVYYHNKSKMLDFLKIFLKIWKEFLDKIFHMINMSEKLSLSKLNFVLMKLNCVYLLQLLWKLLILNLKKKMMLLLSFNFNIDLKIDLETTKNLTLKKNPHKPLPKKLLLIKDSKDLNISLTKSNLVSSDNSLP